jgi:hypothetical protein
MNCFGGTSVRYNGSGTEDSERDDVEGLPDRPWGWIAFSDVDGLPDICDVAQAPARAAVGPAAPSPSTSADVRMRSCRWDADGVRTLLVSTTWYTRSGLHSGSSIAASHLLSSGPGVAVWSTGRLASVPGASGLGDAALSASVGTDAGPPSGAYVAVRQDNVIVLALLTVRAGPQAPDGLTRADETNLINVIKAILTAVRSG